ncbi:MAG: XTP/dITP diphosphatase [Dehalococcoidia bacterium]|nr:XTP/dITP diphosphatase [Dehalococcoidia bacterium]
MKILLASNNQGKVREFVSLISHPAWELTTPSLEGIEIDVEETGKTFEQNATLKALAYAEVSGMITIADDSGLEVEGLNGEPGVQSARYAGMGASDKQRIELLLSKLAGVSWEKRTARFRCVIAIAFPDGKVELCQGECPGIIGFEPKGTKGFGYDPIFYMPEFAGTMAEISDEQKNRVSHRGKAAVEARRLLISRLCN